MVKKQSVPAWGMLAIRVDRRLALVQERVGTGSWPVAIALWV